MSDLPVEVPAEVVEPAVEAPVVTEPVEEPVVEEPAGPTYDWADEAIQAQAAEALARQTEWGDPEGVQQALAIQKSLQTDDGISQLFVEAARHLGISKEQLDGLFAPEAQPEGEPSWDEDPDRVLTVAEVKRLLDEQVIAPRRQAEQEAVTAIARTTVTETLGALGVTDQSEVNAVLALGQQFIDNDDLDPEHLKAAVRKGFAEYERVTKERATKYLTAKHEQTKTLPGSIGAAPPGGVELPEPANVEEAKKRVRARLGL